MFNEYVYYANNIIIQMTSLDLYDELMRNAPQIELSSSRNSNQSANTRTDEFQIKMRDCQRLIVQIRNHNDDIWNFKDKLINNTRSQKQAEACRLIKAKCDQNFQYVKQLQTNLIQIGKLVDQAKTQSPQQPETFSKIYRRQHLAEEIGTIIKRTQQIQLVVQKFSVDTRFKRIKFVMRDDISDKEAMQLANKVDGLQQAVMSKMTGVASLKLKYAHADILSKAQGIAQLQKSVQENLQLMRQVAILVHEQGEMIDNIYKNVSQARDYVGKAEAVLFKQKQQHKKSRKKMCWIILIGIILLGVVLTPIIIKIVKSKQSDSNSNNTPTNSTNTNTTVGFND